MLDNNENIDSKFNKIAAEIIKNKRIEKGYSLEDVVSKMSDDNIITRQALHKYENNEARMKTKIFKNLCKILALDADEVLENVNLKLLNSNNTELINKNEQQQNISDFPNSKIVYTIPNTGLNISYTPIDGIEWEDLTIEEQQKHIADVMDSLYEYKILLKSKEEKK